MEIYFRFLDKSRVAAGASSTAQTTPADLPWTALRGITVPSSAVGAASDRGRAAVSPIAR